MRNKLGRRLNFGGQLLGCLPFPQCGGLLRPLGVHIKFRYHWSGPPSREAKEINSVLTQLQIAFGGPSLSLWTHNCHGSRCRLVTKQNQEHSRLNGEWSEGPNLEILGSPGLWPVSQPTEPPITLEQALMGLPRGRLRLLFISDLRIAPISIQVS